MTLSLAIALFVTADLALIAGLAYVMSRAARLTPHLAGSPAQRAGAERTSRRVPTRRPQRSNRTLAGARV